MLKILSVRLERQRHYKCIYQKVRYTIIINVVKSHFTMLVLY